MPDLKSELAKLKDLKFDDDPETPEQQSATDDKNTTREIFLWFQANPMSTVRELCNGLSLQSTPASARTNQLFKRKLLTRKKVGDQPYRYTTTVDVYPEVPEALKTALSKAHVARAAQRAAAKKAPPPKTKSTKTVRQQLQKARAAKAAKRVEALEALAVMAVPPFDATKIVSAWTPFQAKAVYDELKRLFGGGL